MTGVADPIPGPIPPLWRQMAATWRARACPEGPGAWGVDDDEVRLLRASFAQVAALAAPAAILFFGRLFRIAPELRGVFAGADMRAEGRRFIAALGDALALLDQLDRPAPLARAVAGQWGLGPQHHRPLGEALEWMLEECLAEDFSADLRDVWARAYRGVPAPMAGEGLSALG